MGYGRTALTGALFLAALLASPLAALAQTYPDKPIRLIVPFAPGGGGDTLARSVSMAASEALGQQVVVDNKPGAGGNVGSELAARAPADGYTILYGTNGTHAINHALYSRTGFDAIKDFEPVSRLTRIAGIVVVTNTMPVNSVKELLDYVRANPGKVNFGSAGNGTTSHVAGEMFKQDANVDIVHIPYRGNGPAMVDLTAGQVQMMIDVMPAAYPHVKSGNIRALAVTTSTRVGSVPELPTLAEAGVPNFDMSAWDGIWAPAGTPRPIVDRLNAAFNKALESAAVRERLVTMGAEPVGGKPEDLGRHVASELARWAEVVKKSGARID